MKKVLFVMPNLIGGGAEKVLVDILNYIDSSKFEISLLLFNKEGIYLDRIPHEIKVISINDKIKFIPYKIWIRLYKYFPKLFYSIIVKEQYDTEIAFMEGYATNFIGNSTNKNSKKIAWVHTDLFKLHWTKNMFLPGEEAKIYNKFNDIVFVSDDARVSFNKLFNENKATKKVIYNPIISDEIVKKANETDIEFDEFTIISVGRLNKAKGYDRLINIHSELVKMYPHKLLILGEGEERKKLENIIKDRGVEKTVELKGFVNNPYPYIKSADVFISSSRSEGYSLVVAESIVLEKAIISTNTVGPRELLDNGKYGLLCEESYEGIKNSLEKLLKNKELVKEYSELSKRRKQFFDYNSIINKIEKIL